MGSRSAAKTKIGSIPEVLVAEHLNGIPFFYKGYEKIIENPEKLAAIMGSSALQAEIIQYLLRICLTGLDSKKYRIYTNEIGSHISKNTNTSHDLAIFDKNVLTPDLITSKYTAVPADLVVEVDVDVVSEQISELEYIVRKNRLLLEFGVKRIIWIFSGVQKVLIITPDNFNKLILEDWNQDIILLDGISFNIGAYLREEGVKLPN